LIELSPFHDDWSQCRISRRFCRWSHYQNLFLEADFGSGGRCDSNTPIGILIGNREEAAVKFYKKNGRRGVWRRYIDSRGCEDHGGGLGLFREALEDEIRLDKNQKSHGEFVGGFVVVGEMALGERVYYL
jgi:hypothetical protein